MVNICYCVKKLPYQLDEMKTRLTPLFYLSALIKKNTKTISKKTIEISFVAIVKFL